MSSTTIEKNIVQMEFDAKKFRDGVSQSTDSLTKFKSQFDFTQAQDTLEDLDDMARVDFSRMEQSLASINNKLSLMSVAAGVVIAKITDSVISGVKSIGNAVLIDPIKTGLEEYETQLNSVQTILANTQKAGTTLDDVNGALDELNRYADLTIYNFTQMTENIGKFTAAGVELDTSVAAIKGISNLAALSGSNSQQASTAMYQLSQAISTGSLKLQDWNSVVNAGMGGQVFQDALMDTARVHGLAIDDMIADAGSFRESLSTGWITSEFLLETLNKLTGDLTDAELERMGYNEEQIAGIQAQAETALDAATKIKTVTQLIDTMKEALQSGWAQTWRWVFGDFEQAKELWGSVAEVLGGLIEEDAAARNALLQGWSERGGRATAVQALMDVLKGGVNILDAFREAVSDVFKPLEVTDLLGITRKIGELATKFRESTTGLDNFKSIVRGVAAIVDIFFRIIGAGLRVLSLLFGGIQLVDGGIWFLLARIADAIVAWREWAVRMNIFTAVAETIVHHIRNLRENISKLIRQFLDLEIVQKVIKWFKGLGRDDWLNVLRAAETVLRAIVAPFYLLAIGAQTLYREIAKLKIIKDIVAWFNNIDWQATAQYFKDLASEIGVFFGEIRDGGNKALGDFSGFIEDTILKVEELWDSFRNSDVITSFIDLVNTFDGRRMDQFLKDAEEGFSWVDSITEAMGPRVDWLVGKLGDAGSKVKELAGGMLEGLTDVFKYLAENADDIDYSHLFDIINAGLLGGMLLSIRKIASGDFISGIIDDSDFGEGIIDIFGKLEGTIGSFQNNIRADTLQKIAVSIAVLAGSIFLLTLIDSTKLSQATGAIAVMIATLFGASGALKLVKPQDAIKSSIAIIGLALAVGIMGVGLRIISGIDPAQMEAGLKAIAAGLVLLIGTVQGLRATTGTLKSILVMQGLAVSLAALWLVIQLFGRMDPEILGQGLLGVSASISILTLALVALSRGGGDKNSSLKASLAMLAIAQAMAKLHKSVAKFGEMEPDKLKQGLLAIGAIMAGMSLFSRVVKTDKILQAAAAMFVIGVSLLVIQKAIEAFGSMDLEELVVGILALSLMIVLLAAAGLLMQNALPGALAMIVMAGALVILGVALKIIGAIPVEQLVVAILAIALVLGVFILAGYLLAPVVIVLIAFGAALMLIGLGAALFGAGIFLAALGLVMLAGSAFAIAGALQVVGKAVFEILPAMAIAFVETITTFFVTLAEKAPELKEAFKTLILTAIEGITEIVPQITELVGTMVVEIVTVLLEKLVELYGELNDAGWALLLEFLHGIEDNIQEVVTTALSIINEFIQGITEGLPDIIASAVELYFTFLEAIEEEVITSENIQRLIGIGVSIGENIVDGLVLGLAEGLGRIVGKVWDLVKAAKDAFSQGVEEASPSKFTYRVGKNVVLGFVNAIKDGITRTVAGIRQFVADAKRQFDPLVDQLAQELDGAIQLNPLITPVLDLSNITAGSGLLQSAFENVSIPVDLTGADSRTDSVEPIGSDNKNGTGVTYNQYNYSPVALDRPTIYRQTKTQVARFARRAFEE
jgi:tape measure domain-containing protein